MRSITKLGAAVVVTATLALTGACGDAGQDKTTAAGSGKPSLSLADALASSVKDLGTTSYAYSVKAGTSVSRGSADAATGKLQVSTSMDFFGTRPTIEGRVDGNDWHVKVDQGPDAFAGKWVRLDPVKLKGTTALGVQDLKDPAQIRLMIAALTATEKAADGTIKGTLDLAKISDEVLFLDFNLTMAMSLGDKAKAVPFQATLDGSGRLSGLTFEVPGVEDEAPAPVAYSFNDWGKAVTVEKPAGAIEATQAIYDYFNRGKGK